MTITTLNTYMDVIEPIVLQISNPVLQSSNTIDPKKTNVDISTIFRNVYNFSLICKKIHEKVKQMTNTILVSLSKKFDKPAEEIAAQFYNSNNRKWLENYIEEKGDKEIYSVIKQISQIALSISDEVKSIKAVDTLEFKSTDQMRSGYRLLLHENDISVSTRLGRIRILSLPKSGQDYYYSIAGKLINHLSATYETITYDKAVKGEPTPTFINEVGPQKPSDPLKKIPDGEVKMITLQVANSKRDTQNVIVCLDPFSRSCYKIKAINGQNLPNPVIYTDRTGERSIRLLKKIWVLLTSNKEEKPLVGSLNNALTSMPMVSLAQQTTKEKPYETDVPNLLNKVTDLLTKLQQTRTIRGLGYSILVLDGPKIIKFIYSLNQAAKASLGEHAWDIKEWQNPSSPIYGLTLNPKDTDCPHSSIAAVYQTIMDELKIGWKRETPTEDAYIYSKESKLHSQEHLLLDSLAALYCLSDFVKCTPLDNNNNNNSSFIKLEIKKSQFQTVIKTLKIIATENNRNLKLKDKNN